MIKTSGNVALTQPEDLGLRLIEDYKQNKKLNISLQSKPMTSNSKSRQTKVVPMAHQHNLSAHQLQHKQPYLPVKNNNFLKSSIQNITVNSSLSRIDEEYKGVNSGNNNN